MKRQVGAARRFEEIRTRQRELEIALALVDLDALDGSRERLRASLTENETEREGAAGRVAALEADIERLRGHSAEADSR